MSAFQCAKSSRMCTISTFKICIFNNCIVFTFLMLQLWQFLWHIFDICVKNVVYIGGISRRHESQHNTQKHTKSYDQLNPLIYWLFWLKPKPKHFHHLALSFVISLQIFVTLQKYSELVLGFRHPWFFPIWVFHVNPCVSVIYCFSVFRWVINYRLIFLISFRIKLILL